MHVDLWRNLIMECVLDIRELLTLRCDTSIMIMQVNVLILRKYMRKYLGVKSMISFNFQRAHPKNVFNTCVCMYKKKTTNANC